MIVVMRFDRFMVLRKNGLAHDHHGEPGEDGAATK